MATKADIAHARRNGRGSALGTGGRMLNSDAIVDLLVETSNPGRHAAARRNANALLEFMAMDTWRPTSPAHRGGFGDLQRGADGSWHITLSFGRGRSYHLRLGIRGHVFEITGPGMAELAPWASPGSDPLARTD